MSLAEDYPFILTIYILAIFELAFRYPKIALFITTVSLIWAIGMKIMYFLYPPDVSVIEYGKYAGVIQIATRCDPVEQQS